MLVRSIVLSLAVCSQITFAQDFVGLDAGAVGVDQTLRKLQTIASVLHVVAHPDDEDGAMMTYCSRGLGVRTMLFSITRGEGGANLISNHFFDELGALRTLEHAKAAEFYGVEVFYSHAVDYGYSKTLAEARKQWVDGLPILEDLVEVIRREKPTIMLSRFQGSDRDGHGHHQMAGVISRLGFDAAADPDRFPEQIAKGLEPWQVKKLYMNNIRPQWRPEDKGAWTIAIPTGNFDPVIGKTYAQVARYGLGFQRSQGISGHESDAEPRDSYYRLIRVAGEPTDDPSLADVKESSLFEELDTSLAGLVPALTNNLAAAESLLELENKILEATTAFRFREPASMIAPLVEALQISKQLQKQETNAYIASVIRKKASELELAIQQASGIDVQCYATDKDGQSTEFVIPGQKLDVHLRIANQSDLPIKLRQLVVNPASWATSGPELDSSTVAAGEVLETSFPARVPLDAPVTRPGFHRQSVREPFYSTTDDYQQRSQPACPLVVTSKLEVAGVEISIASDVHTRMRDPEFGNVRYPITVVPPIGVRFMLTDGVMPIDRTHYDLDLSLTNAVPSASSGEVSMTLPAGWTSNPESHSFQFARPGESSTVRFRLTPTSSNLSGEHEIRAIARYENKEYSTGYTTVTARDIGRMNVYRDAVHRLRVADIKLSGTPRVGYIAGSGDQVAESLGMLGVSPVMLSASDLESGSLDEFAIILVGVRAYAVRTDLRNNNQRLLDYVEQGGVVIVQYQTPEFDNNFGPYPYTMGRNPEEVSEEDSAVTILAPEHVLFTRPNRITSTDFENWVEQRGSKFFATWDDRYIPLLECHDTGQNAQRGGMLIAKHGTGVYIYSAYAWYRQLPNGVPGAYRLMANMLSLPTELVSKNE